MTPDPTTSPRAVGGWALTGRTLVALGIGALFWATHLAAAPAYPPFLQVWFVVVDPLLALIALVLVLRFSAWHPPVVAVAAVLLAVGSEFAVGPAVVALAAVAEQRRWRPILIAAVAFGLGMSFSGVLYPSRSGIALEWWMQVAFAVLVVGVIVAVGVAIGQRRALLAGLRERADAVEREQAAREQAARVAERNRIAHDMHDVVAHRISLVALHAGALGYRTDLDEVERRAAIDAIEQNARAALTELRDVLGVLRSSDESAAEPAPPQPGIDDITTLVADGRGAGMSIALETELDGTPPLIVSQAAYRIVREALSNARKHARDADVTVSLAGEDGEGLAIVVSNTSPRADVRHEPLPGSGMGLIGLAERVEAIGGRITSGTRDGDGFAVSAWLPWST